MGATSASSGSLKVGLPASAILHVTERYKIVAGRAPSVDHPGSMHLGTHGFTCDLMFSAGHMHARTGCEGVAMRAEQSVRARIGR